MSQITELVANDVFALPDFLHAEGGVLVHAMPGRYNQYGEFVNGETKRTRVNLISAPLIGEERAVLPDGINLENVRRFWLQEPVSAAIEGERGSTGDIIEFEGTSYRIVLVENWQSFWQATGVAI